ncbi:MAG: PilX N-terminal domain-containing pilus assembly protein [Lautropia sp.]|nr:PilX N-terminal domain-containing pilus assembly protein [Lautropia sp.]
MKGMKEAMFGRKRVSGNVLLTTLIMMAVMGLGAAMAVKMSINNDMVSANLRNRQLAFQAAETALRHCEKLLEDDPAAVHVITNFKSVYSDNEWTHEDQWRDFGIAVPVDKLGMPDTLRTIELPPRTVDSSQTSHLSISPQCLVRHFTLDEWRERYPTKPGTVTAETRGFDTRHIFMYRISARGYSPDYMPPHRPDDPQTTRGAVVQLQSVVRSVQ